jgi:hypothetical protein
VIVSYKKRRNIKGGHLGRLNLREEVEMTEKTLKCMHCDSIENLVLCTKCLTKHVCTECMKPASARKPKEMQPGAVSWQAPLDEDMEDWSAHETVFLGAEPCSSGPITHGKT